MMNETKIATSTGIIMPNDFPLEKYNEIPKYLKKYGTEKKNEKMLFGVGWNGLCYRFRAMTEHDEKYIFSQKKPQPHPHEDLYIQGNEFFSFFYCGVSIVECLFFSIYCLASIIDLKNYPVGIAQKLNFYPIDVEKKYNKHFPKENISEDMTSILSDPMYKQIDNYRNVLSHRGNLPRNIFVGGDSDGTITIPINPKEPSNIWKYDLSFDKDTTLVYRQWLSTKLTDLLVDVDVFCKSHL